MAYVNVKDWSVDQVTEWIKGINSLGCFLTHNLNFAVLMFVSVILGK